MKMMVAKIIGIVQPRPISTKGNIGLNKFIFSGTIVCNVAKNAEKYIKNFASFGLSCRLKKDKKIATNTGGYIICKMGCPIATMFSTLKEAISAEMTQIIVKKAV